MADSFIQLPADSTGKQLDTVIVNMGVGTTAVHREKVVVADPTSTSAFATVTSSQGLQVSSTQAQTISGTVTVLSASSGLVQISGTPAVTSTFTLATPASTAGVVAVVTSSGGVTVSQAVNTAAGFGPVTSSFGRLVTQTTASIPSVINATSANPTPVLITSSGAIAPTTLIASSVSKVSSGAGALYGLWAFTTAATGAIVRLYNATTSSVVMNTGVVSYFVCGAQSTSAGWDDLLVMAGPRPLNFATACSLDVVVTVTSTATVAGNTYCTFQFV